MRTSVLVVDDDKLTRWSLAKLLARLGYTVREAGTGAACLAAIREQRPDVVLLDIVLPDADGLHLLAEIRRTDPQLPVLLMTADPSRESRREAERLGASAYLTKPIEAERLQAALAKHGAHPA